MKKRKFNWMYMFLVISIISLTTMYFLIKPEFAYIVILVYLPTLIYLTIIRWSDIGAKEPRGIIALNVTCGMILIYPAIFLENIGVYLLLNNAISGYFPQLLDYSSNDKFVLLYTLIFFFVIAPIEEGLKYLGFFLVNLLHKENDVPSDSIIYAASIGAGFAIYENAAYILGRAFENGISIYDFYFFNVIEPLELNEFDYETALIIVIVRTIAATPLHIGVGLLMGLYLSNALFSKELNYSRKYQLRCFILAFVIPWIIHSIYNLLTFTLYLYYPDQYIDVLGGVIFAFLLSIIAWKRVIQFRKRITEHHISSFS